MHNYATTIERIYENIFPENRIWLLNQIHATETIYMKCRSCFLAISKKNINKNPIFWKK